MIAGMENHLKSIDDHHKQQIIGARSSVSLLFYLMTLSSMVVAFVFFTGWAYAYHYFAHFKVGLLALNLPIATYPGFSFWVFQAWWWLFLPYVCLVVMLVFFEPRLAFWWARIKENRPLLLMHVQVILTLSAFLLAWWATGISAERYFQGQKANRFSDLPRVGVWLNKPPVDETLRELYEELPKGVYRLLLENQDRLFLFKPSSDGQSVQGPVIELPWKEVKLVRVLP